MEDTLLEALKRKNQPFQTKKAVIPLVIQHDKAHDLILFPWGEQWETAVTAWPQLPCNTSRHAIHMTWL